MSAKINGNSAFKTIIAFANRDFGVTITVGQAREIRAAIQRRSAIWTTERYISTVTGHDIVRMSRAGVCHIHSGNFYPREEWNAKVRAGDFG